MVRSLAIIFVNAVAYFAICMAAFLLTSFLTGSDPTQKDFLSLRPLTLAAVVSVPLAALHAVTIGGAIAYWIDRLSMKPFAGAMVLALFANLLTVFWWLFLFLKLGEDPGPAAMANGALIAAVLTAISFAANLITIQLFRKTENGGVLQPELRRQNL